MARADARDELEALPSSSSPCAALSRGGPCTGGGIARRFRVAPRGPKLAGMLETLAALGQARPLDGGRYTA